MRIARRGATADHGWQTLKPKIKSLSWDRAQTSLLVETTPVKNFSGKSRHKYRVCLAANEVVLLLNALAESARSNPDTLGSDLAPALRSLVQLQALAAGIAPRSTPQREER